MMTTQTAEAFKAFIYCCKDTKIFSNSKIFLELSPSLILAPSVTFPVFFPHFPAFQLQFWSTHLKAPLEFFNSFPFWSFCWTEALETHLCNKFQLILVDSWLQWSWNSLDDAYERFVLKAWQIDTPVGGDHITKAPQYHLKATYLTIADLQLQSTGTWADLYLFFQIID